MLLTTKQISDRYFSGNISPRQIHRWLDSYQVPTIDIGDNHTQVVEKDEFEKFMHLFPCSATYGETCPNRGNLMTIRQVNEEILNNAVSDSTVRRWVHKDGIKHFQSGHNGEIFVDATAAKQLAKHLS